MPRRPGGKSAPARAVNVPSIIGWSYRGVGWRAADLNIDVHARGCPFARLAAARLLRCHVLAQPSTVGAAALSPAEPPHPRGGLTIDEPCVATGTAIDGGPLVVVCAAGADPGAVPFAIDARLRESPGARLVVAVRAGNVTATMSALAAMVRPAAAFVEVPRTA